MLDSVTVVNTLHLTNVNPSYAGEYSCLANNSIGTARNASTLIVCGKCVHVCVWLLVINTNNKTFSYLLYVRMSPFSSHINTLTTHVWFIAENCPVCFYWGCFMIHVRCPQVPQLSIIGSAGC